MFRLKLTILTLFILINAFGQKIEKVFLDKNDSRKNCYTIIYPPKLPWTGYIFIIPGFGETAERVLEQTDLPKLTAKSGLLTIIPTFQDGVLSFGIDNLSQQSFNNIILDVREKHKLTDHNYYVGGFSIGGSVAIKFAENAIIKPTAVFAIDPPLDLERYYNSSKREIRLSVSKSPDEERVYFIERIEKEMGGSPETALKNYYKTSPYSFSDTSQTAIKNIVKLPLRIYSEPDINWWLKENAEDFTGMNVTECSAMINELNRLGNTKAELIITQNKGYRSPDNTKHPHSWSIVDNDELIKWLLGINKDSR
ncbi:alpha/beta hydrolase [Flavobacterium sp. LB2P84]|uniref:alpha/beta hydrolase n=1 Tax=Flavobacterium yafengii TaxID=3041253 RepID=UPI0024A86403|nr:alpha/beta hydrolase [Flavobacterium yafengii]MDI6033343.1 alpha/beta hydrolase [Flavobacterium yafengii]